MTNEQMLAELNAFRVANGREPFADWRKARHMPMLINYRELAAEAAEEVTGADLAKHKDFADPAIAEAVKNEKIPSYKQFARYDKSAPTGVVGFIHQFLTQHPTLTRKQAVHALITGYGVNFSTARTQYQRWYTKNKKGA